MAGHTMAGHTVAGRLAAELLLLLPIALFPALAAQEDPPPIAPDRPGFADAIPTVPAGYFQIEMATHLERETSAHRWLLPTNGFRLGITRRLEWRIAHDSLVHEHSHEGDLGSRAIGHSGWRDLQTGFKLYLTAERGVLPALSLTVMSALPTAQSYFRAPTSGPVAKLSFSHSAPGGLEVGGCYLSGWRRSGLEANAPGVHHQAGSLSLGRSLKWGIQGLVEAFLIDSAIPGSPVAGYYGGGLSKLIGSNAQVDLTFGHLSRFRSPDWYLAIGYSVRTSLFRR